VDEHPFIAGLDPQQRAAVTTTAQPLCILAGAGSGKTRVLTRRIAWRVATGSADARHVLALTFTRKAAGELASRLAALGVRDRVAAGTFHAVAFAQLRRWWAERGQRPSAVLERKARILAPLLRHVAARRGRELLVQPADVAGEIEWAKARLVAPDGYEQAVVAAGRTPPLPPPAMAALFARYEDEKRRRGLVDFDDLLLLCADALEADPAFADQQRWRFRHIFVDEFQDVNPAQFRLLEAWRGGRPDLCVVGDPNQAIYGWNGADHRYLTRFGEHVPGATVVRLDRNYRSSPQILAAAHAVLAGGRRPPPPVRPARPDGPIPTVWACDTDLDEARLVARAVRDRHAPGRPWSDVAVLARTNAQLALFEEAFRAAGIPYRVRGGGAFLDQPEVRQALAELRRCPPGAPFAAALADLEAMLAESGTDAPGSAERRLSLEMLVRLGREYAALEPGASPAGFVAWLDATVHGDEPDGGADAVELATFHRAKGLEWPVVFVTGLERGFVPIGHAAGPAAVAEERRLLYVALTRASHELHCSWARQRTFGSRTMVRAPSPWLADIEAACAGLRAAGPGADWRRQLARTRAELEAARRARERDRPGRPTVGRNADPALLADLKAWRARVARDAAVPAYCVFHDATLAAVAEARPRDRLQLLQVPGIGPAKAERYGDELLALVARHCRPGPAAAAGTG
jgi:DNA helicase-2/ATP-dependent DNA helicase PcrA